MSISINLIGVKGGSSCNLMSPPWLKIPLRRVEKGCLPSTACRFTSRPRDRRILFDTGQNLAISNNARELGIDLNQIDSVVLSHGHYDHTGGLQSLLACNSNFTLYAHPDVFGQKVKQQNDEYKYIGISR